MAKIFISYSRKDTKFAHRLATDLDRLGAQIWLDTKDIPAGMKWSSAIQEGLDQTDVMLVIVSPDAMASRHVEDEWNYFQDQGRPIIPILYRTAKINFQLQRIQYVDFSNQKYPLAELVEELRRYGVNLQQPSTASTGHRTGSEKATSEKLTPAIHPQKSSSGLVVAGILIVLVLAGIVILPRLNGSQITPTPTSVPLAINPISADTVGNIQLCVDGTANPGTSLTVRISDANDGTINEVTAFVSERGRWKAYLAVASQVDSSGTIAVRQDNLDANLPVHLGKDYTPGAPPLGPRKSESVDECATNGNKALGQ